jgi:hypothetical protein
LTGAGKPAITGVNLTVKAEVAESVFTRLREVNALLAVGQEVETITAATYLAALGALQNNAALKVAASIHPIENAHATAIAFILGRTPVPEGFGRTDGARTTSDSVG